MEERTNPVFYKLCKQIEHLARPKKITIDDNAVGEDIEVYSSFRSSVCVTIHACKLEQVALSSDSDSDIERSDCKPSPEKQPKCSYCPLHPAPDHVLLIVRFLLHTNQYHPRDNLLRRFLLPFLQNVFGKRNINYSPAQNVIVF